MDVTAAIVGVNQRFLFVPLGVLNSQRHLNPEGPDLQPAK